LKDACELVTKHLRRLIPSSLCVVYKYDHNRDELVAEHAVGEDTALVKGLRIPLGQRLSGWVAANRQIIVNSDPILDLGDVARSTIPRLKNCLSAPIVDNDEIVGVLTLYSTNAEGFSSDHRRIIELVATEAAPTFNRVSQVEMSFDRQLFADLPGIRQLEQSIQSARSRQLGSRPEFTLLAIEVLGLQQLNLSHSRKMNDDLLRFVVSHTRNALRLSDTLYRVCDDNFVAFLGQADEDTARAIADRIRDSVRERPIEFRQFPIAVNVEVMRVPAPARGQSLQDVFDKMRLQGRQPPGNTPRSVVH
jgi:GGDEF domain-containing protein